MARYLKKNQKEDEKKMISTRIRTHVIDAFQNASEDASSNGYTLTLSSIVERALKDAIGEYAEVKGTNYLKIEKDRLYEEWAKEKEEEDLLKWKKYEEAMRAEEIRIMDQEYQNFQKDNEAILNMSSKDLKAYQEKRKKEIAAEKKEIKITIDRIKKKFDKEKAEEKDNKAKQKTNKEDIK